MLGPEADSAGECTKAGESCSNVRALPFSRNTTREKGCARDKRESVVTNIPDAQRRLRLSNYCLLMKHRRAEDSLSHVAHRNCGRWKEYPLSDWVRSELEGHVDVIGERRGKEVEKETSLDVCFSGLWHPLKSPSLLPTL